LIERPMKPLLWLADFLDWAFETAERWWQELKRH